MRLYFHVDRSLGLKPGDEVHKEPYYGESILPALMPFADESFLHHLDKISRDGLSIHGAQYLIKAGQRRDINLINCLLELQFEYVRHIYHKNKPSRLQSMFAFNEYEYALRFKREHGNTGVIYEIDFSGLCFVGDMNWLKPDICPIAQKHKAMSYWSGQPYETEKHYEPLWECVIDLPVKIIRQVED